MIYCCDNVRPPGVPLTFQYVHVFVYGVVCVVWCVVCVSYSVCVCGVECMYVSVVCVWCDCGLCVWLWCVWGCGGCVYSLVCGVCVWCVKEDSEMSILRLISQQYVCALNHSCPSAHHEWESGGIAPPNGGK